jgi:MtN3 and saliva related transmembrane protein
MDSVTWIGIAASVGTGISLLPQLIKICREKKAADISYPMLATLLGGLACWIWYGVIKNDAIIIISNAVSLCINLAIFYYNNKYKKK